MNWGKWIVVSFFLFGGLIITMVVISMNTNIDLVAKNYYEQEINYQVRIDQMKNTAGLENKPKITVANGSLIIRFHPEELAGFKNGELKLFSPVNKEEDKVYVLEKIYFPDYSVDISEKRSGLWMVMLEWEDAEKMYYLEKQITF